MNNEPREETLSEEVYPLPNGNPLICEMPAKAKRRFRSETRICVGCELEVSYRFQVDGDRLAGHFRQAISSTDCPKCESMTKAAREGDVKCQKFLASRGVEVAPLVTINTRHFESEGLG